MHDFKAFEDSVGVTFQDKKFLEMAFTHRSYLNENRHKHLVHNERLEFLGDAVLELVVTEYLFEKYPDTAEGKLTAYRAGLVNTSTLSSVATKLGMNDYLLLSKGEAKDTGRARHYILANTFEAVVGAIHLDQGYGKAKEFITAHILSLTEAIVEENLWQDSKSRFQEVAQEKESITPQYESLKEVGPDHDKHFTIGVFLGKEKIAEGEGKSKQEAEQHAAGNALRAKGWS